MNIKISIDGAKTWIDAPEGVRIFVDGLPIADEEGDLHDGGLCFNLTHEGLIIDAHSDFFDDAKPDEAISVATSSQTYDEITNDLGL